MKEIIDIIEGKIQILDAHPLFSWLASDKTSPRERMMILPSVANMAMGFRDVNKWVLRYPRAENALQHGINLHTFEDQTHARLYLEDWRRLGLDKRLGWKASDTLWWLFQAEANEVARGYSMYFLSMAAADGNDPLLRFAHAEVGERCARDIFFKHISQVASELSRQTGVNYLYFGPNHLASEGKSAEPLFETQVLDAPQRQRARELVEDMAAVFVQAFDGMLSYAQRYVATGSVPRPSAAPPAAGSRPTRTAVRAGSEVRRTEPAVHASQASLQGLLDERRVRTARHPFYTWLNHRGERLSAVQSVQRFFPMWALDVLGSRDLHHYVMRYPEPRTELEHAVNGWVDELTGQDTGYLEDWRQLRLDEVLGWKASDTLDFCYFDRLVEVHRRNRVKVVKLAAGHPEPLPRLWLMHALATSTEAFFDNSSIVAGEIEASTDLRLDFLAGRTRPAAAAAPVARFKDVPMSLAQAEVVAEMLKTVFDVIDEQLDVSLEVALSNTLNIP